MIKKLAAAALGLALTITPAFALNQFYSQKIGQWSIEGYTGEKNFCSAKTYWVADNGGQSYMSMFNMQGTQAFSLMIHNEDWSMMGQTGVVYPIDIDFSGQAGFNTLHGNFELKDSQTIIVRNLTGAFLDDWIKYRIMRVNMPGGIPSLAVGLGGTSDAVYGLAQCVKALNGNTGE